MQSDYAGSKDSWLCCQSMQVPWHHLESYILIRQMLSFCTLSPCECLQYLWRFSIHFIQTYICQQVQQNSEKCRAWNRCLHFPALSGLSIFYVFLVIHVCALVFKKLNSLLLRYSYNQRWHSLWGLVHFALAFGCSFFSKYKVAKIKFVCLCNCSSVHTFNHDLCFPLGFFLGGGVQCSSMAIVWSTQSFLPARQNDPRSPTPVWFWGFS